ncbi:cation diffusion facilitator family transporter [Streptococcus halichoeri]|uniref:cation diffusion facilitator family transporter n=1 Tax=Streptococcus halichoeri TaxID=254785 RepID=UPI001359DA7E|nr:cation diffusion facilitator family transporter [Streptococcus halichoeri]
MKQDPIDNVKMAKRGPLVSICAYLVISIAKLVMGTLWHSNSLIADGFNNLSDIVGNVALLIGLHLASQPADNNHRFGHWKFEDISSLITSFMMFFVGFQVLTQTIEAIIANDQTAVDPLGAIVGLVSALIMFFVYTYNKRLSKRVKSSALVAASKDNLSDAVTSIGTAVAILAASLHLTIIDRIAAIIITFFILKTAFDIFMQSAFSLSDGFDNRHLKKYEQAILEIPKVNAVKSQRGRTYGSNVYLDIVLEMNPDLSVYESHAITEQVEQMLSERFAVYDIDIHVEPSRIPEDEIPANVQAKLLRQEKMILAKIPQYQELLSDDFLLIDSSGKSLTKAQLDSHVYSQRTEIENISFVSLSQKTKLLSYELDGYLHTSLWRRKETWYLRHHQVTPIKKKIASVKHKRYHISKIT